MTLDDNAILQAAATIVAAQISANAFGDVTDQAVMKSALDAALTAVALASKEWKKPTGSTFLSGNRP